MSKTDKIDCELRTDKGFYIGDICYVLDDRTYGEWCGKYPKNTRLFNVDDSAFAVGNTRYGDGTYADFQGNYYDVDAGVIGVIPFEVMEKHHRADMNTDSGRMIQTDAPTRIRFMCDRFGEFVIAWCKVGDELGVEQVVITTDEGEDE